MREILFRGKRVDNGEWAYGMPCATEESGIFSIQTLVGGIFDIIPETVGQYTGLTDKNGKKIFEGDIVKNEYEKGHYQYFKIFYCDRTHMWQGENKYGMLSKVYQMLGTLEVIGNIHDNPELLKGE